MRVVIAGVFALLMIAGPVRAQPGRTPVGPPQAYAPQGYAPQAPPVTYTKRYGSTIALADAASVAAIVVGTILIVSAAFSDYDCDYDCDDDSGSVGLGVVLMIGGSAGYVFGGPLIHNYHGNGSASGKSIALRLGLPLAGALAGAALSAGDESCYDCDDYSGGLSALGVISAMVIDWTVLAKKQVRVDAPVVPYAAPMHGGGMTLGVGGTF